ncbi:hypothetical protein [Halolamina rubra]|uniref:hypothetical protein n=1 Tax=Halolamina rubra TaxID=1380430 RepID=UPI000678593F|nr:hypothetical protein [Halolamina rubra]
MTSVWSYPWRLLAPEGRSLADLQMRGLDGVSVASHYHSIRSLAPTTDGPQFDSFPGGCFFDPGEHTEGTAIDPHVHSVLGHESPLEELLAEPAADDLSMTGWLVCLHNTHLGSCNPRFRIESAFGQPHDHGLCPSNPEVRAYLASIAEALAALGVDAIGLEAIGFPSAFHGHGNQFGHEKDQLVASTREQALFSQCFCDACRAAADFDIDMAQSVVQEYCRAMLETPEDTVPSLSAVVEDHPVLEDLFTFRARVVESLIGRIDRASGDVPLRYYAAAGLGRDRDDGWPAGVDLDCLAPYLDRVTALCYTGDPTVARERVSEFNEVTGVTVDAGLSLEPEYVVNREEWTALRDAVASELQGELRVYNESLLSEKQFDWVIQPD